MLQLASVTDKQVMLKRLLVETAGFNGSMVSYQRLLVETVSMTDCRVSFKVLLTQLRHFQSFISSSCYQCTICGRSFSVHKVTAIPKPELLLASC